MKISAFFTALVMALSLYNVAHAKVIVNDGIYDWEITTIHGSFDSINADPSTPNLTLQPWWGSASVAGFFANTVAEQFDFPISGIYGPFFAWGYRSSSESEVAFCNNFSGPYGNCGPSSVLMTHYPYPKTATAVFAVAEKVSPVPVPAGLPLVLTGLAGFAGLRMRKKRKAQV